MFETGRQVVLLARERAVARLRRDGGLEGLVGEVGADPERLSALLAGEVAGPFVRIDPSFVVPEAGPPAPVKPGVPPRSGTLDFELRDRIFAHLSGKTVCHLAVIEGPEKAGEGRDIQDVTIDGPVDLLGLDRWYDEFEKEARARMPKRAGEYRHVLVLALTGEVAGEAEIASLTRLLNRGRPDRFDACYLMFRQLNLGPGRDGSERRFHSRQVWPVAVSRLLSLLHARAQGNTHADAATGVFAWQAEDLGLDDRTEAEPLLPHLLEAQRKILATRADEALHIEIDATPGQPPSGPRLAAKDDLDGLAAKSWLAIEPYSRWPDTVLDPARWKTDLEQGGRRFVEDSILRHQWAGDVRSFIEGLWSGVRANPMGADRVAKRLFDRPPPDSKSGLAAAASTWRKLVATESERMTLGAEAKAFGQFMDRARYGFVAFPFRLVIVAVSAALCIYLAAYLYAALASGEQRTSWTIGTIGTVLILSVGYALLARGLEHRQGRKDRDAFVDRLREVEKRLIERDRLARETLATAAYFQTSLRFRQARIWVDKLVERVQTIVSTELSGSHRAEVPEDDDKVATGRLDRECRDFIRASSHAPLARSFSPSTIQEAGDRAAERWRDELDLRWTAWASRFPDGHLPAAGLIRFLRGEVARLEERLVAETLEVAREEQIETVERLIERLASNPSLPFLSLPYRSEFIRAAEDASGVAFVVHPGCPERFLQHHGKRTVHWMPGAIPPAHLGCVVRTVRLTGVRFDEKECVWTLAPGDWEGPAPEAAPRAEGSP